MVCGALEPADRLVGAGVVAAGSGLTGAAGVATGVVLDAAGESVGAGAGD